MLLLQATKACRADTRGLRRALGATRRVDTSSWQSVCPAIENAIEELNVARAMLHRAEDG
jgi:hypothetical protein